MSQSRTGSRSRRVAALALCACAVMAQVENSLAQEITAGVRLDDGDAVVSDEAIGSMATDSDVSGEYGGAQRNDGLDSDMTDHGYGASEPRCEQRQWSGWFGAEYLLWSLESNRLPPLITAGPASTPRADVAQLDDTGTLILSGDESVNDGWRNGYRLFGGFWFDGGHTCGISADYFDAGNDGYDFVSTQEATIIIGRPFFNAEIGANDVQFLSIPLELDGTAEVRSNDDFRGAGITLNRSLWCCCDPCCSGNRSNIWLLGGYRYYKYDSNLSMTEQLTVLPGTLTPLVPGTTFFLQDSFRTRNEFNGGEIGLQGARQRRWWWLDSTAKVAMGVQHRTVTIDGETFIDVPGGGTASAAGGLLTSELTNIGRYDDSDFVLIPEFRLGVGTRVTESLSMRIGYNLIIWGDVARAASHLPPGLAVDPRNLPPIEAGGGSEPAFPGVRGSQLVAHGFDAGFMWQW